MNGIESDVGRNNEQKFENVPIGHKRLKYEDEKSVSTIFASPLIKNPLNSSFSLISKQRKFKFLMIMM